jgi:hypothetical protein
MSAPTVSPAPVPAAAPERPPSVFAAAYLLSGASAFWLSGSIATIFAIPQYSRYYGDRQQDPVAGSLAALLLIIAALVALAAVAPSVLLAVLDAQGRRAARVLTWIFGGVAVCVAGCLLLFGVFGAIPWHRWLMTGTAVLTLVFVPATGVLLALPSSGRYFRAAREYREAHRPRARAYPPAGPGYPPPMPGYPPPPYPPRYPPAYGRPPMPPGTYPPPGRPGSAPTGGPPAG